MPGEQGVVIRTKDYPRFYGRIPLLHSEVYNTSRVDKRKLRGGVFFMKKLRDTNTLTLAAMLTALGIVLGFLKIPINQIIEIRFGSLPIGIAGMSLGPGIAAIVGALTDIGGYLVKPTGPFFPGFTISGIVSGLIFGFILYNKKPTLARIVAAEAVHTLIVGIIMNTYWLDMMYIKKGFFVTLVARLPKELVMLPINILMLYIVLEAFGRIKTYARV